MNEFSFSRLFPGVAASEDQQVMKRSGVFPQIATRWQCWAPGETRLPRGGRMLVSGFSWWSTLGQVCRYTLNSRDGEDDCSQSGLRFVSNAVLVRGSLSVKNGCNLHTLSHSTTRSFRHQLMLICESKCGYTALMLKDSQHFAHGYKERKKTRRKLAPRFSRRQVY